MLRLPRTEMVTKALYNTAHNAKFASTNKMCVRAGAHSQCTSVQTLQIFALADVQKGT